MRRSHNDGSGRKGGKHVLRLALENGVQGAPADRGVPDALLRSGAEGKIQRMDLGRIDADLIQDQEITQLVVHKQRRNIQDQNYQQHRDRPYEDMRKDQTAPNFPEKLAFQERGKLPGVVNSRYGKKQNEEVQRNLLARGQRTLDARGKQQGFQNPEDNQDESENPHPGLRKEPAHIPSHSVPPKNSSQDTRPGVDNGKQAPGPVSPTHNQTD